MKALLKQLGKRGIIYYPFFAKITGSVKSAVLLSHIIYWWEAVGQRPFYKTNEEFCQEIGMNINEFKAAKTMLQNLTFVKMYVEGVPPKSYYHIDLAQAENQLIQLAGNQPINKSNVSLTSGLESTSILYTKNTKDITSSSTEDEIPIQKENKKEEKHILEKEKVTDDLDRLPETFGSTPLKRLVKIYSLIWKDKYGFYPTITKWGQLGKQFKLLISTFTEYQLSAIIVLHFDWKGANGDSDFIHKRLSEKCFPLEWVQPAVNEYVAYLKNSIGLNFDDKKEVKSYVVKIIKPLINKN